MTPIQKNTFPMPPLSRRGPLAWRWTALLVAISIAAGTIVLWRALCVKDTAHLQAVVAAAATGIETDIGEDMRTRTIDLARIAKLWQASMQPDMQRFSIHGSLYLSRYTLSV